MNPSTENGVMGGFDLATVYKVLIKAHLRSLHVFSEDGTDEDALPQPVMFRNGEEME